MGNGTRMLVQQVQCFAYGGPGFNPEDPIWFPQVTPKVISGGTENEVSTENLQMDVVQKTKKL